jgi:16S rRNA (uracil1498-N3)-methyltransferase
LTSVQSHYLEDVLRLKPGDTVLVFDGERGEWLAELGREGRRTKILIVGTPIRPQTGPGDLDYLFAPLKRMRLDYVVQKAVEMGVSRLRPVITRHTSTERVNTGRLRANAIEAAEQCGILTIPEVAEPISLEQALADLEPNRVLVFCDEDAPCGDPLAALGSAKREPRPPLAVLIGPEGGFSEEERGRIVARDGVVRLSLGPRILRADTAGVAALALVQTVLGDWIA